MEKSLTDFDKLISDRNLTDEDVFIVYKRPITKAMNKFLMEKLVKSLGQLKIDLGPVIFRIRE